MALRILTPDGFILLSDDKSCHGEPLAFALVRSMKSFLVLTIPGRENVFKRRYAAVHERAAFIFIDCTTSMEDIYTKIISCTPSCCIFDCVDLFINMFTVDLIVRLIFRLKAKVPILAVFSRTSINEEEYKRFCAIANSIINIQKREDRCVSELVIYKKNGKRTSMTETFTLENDLKISSERFVPPGVTTVAVAENRNIAMDLEPELSEKELAAKSRLTLPFTSVSKQNELINLRLTDRKVRVGGQIIYVPDKDDDLDDSDPDEDLNL